MTQGAVFRKGKTAPSFLCPFSENRPGKEAFMEKERLDRTLEREDTAQTRLPLDGGDTP